MKYLMLFLLSLSVFTQAQEVQSDTPPSELHEIQPPRPSEDFEWVSGHWTQKDKGEWQWESGYWHKKGASSSESAQKGNPRAQEEKREQSSKEQ